MKSKRILSLILTLVFCLTALIACEKDSAPSELDYKVTVKDALGTPYGAGVIVKFMKDGTQVAMQSCNENGEAVKTLAAGDYTVELAFTGNAEDYYYDSNVTLTVSAYETEVILSKRITSEPVALFAPTGETEAYGVSVGCTYIEPNKEMRSYFLFVPTEAGRYSISLINGENASIGYYGSPHFVQEQNLATVSKNRFEISVSASMIGDSVSGTSTYVIGVDCVDGNAEGCILAIERIGDPEKTIEDEPWHIYEKTVELDAYELPAGTSLKAFDLTASTDAYTLVLNENDGFYHLGTADGPLVYVSLTEDNQYIACFKNILDRSGVSRYFYDEDGNFEKKVSYSECLLEYIAVADEVEGVYPLTEDLKHIIQQRGEYVGWWNPDSNGYLFKDINGNNDLTINTEIAWLLMCLYAE
ncbi:MAG: hypothetical protein IKK70_02965 [Clostridia bacterium]|nr:hypothetical protein [Clostridia bacterium]